jgi:ribonuclease HI
MINIQYEGLAGHPKARCLHLQLSKEEVVNATISLVESLKDSNSLMVYTDGSYDLEKGGASAAVSLSPNLTFLEALGINPYFSNHECEAIGVLLALHLIQNATQQGRIPNAHVFTNNTGVLRRLDNCTAAKTGQYIFREIAAKWRELQTDVDITFVWCPGHQGIQGNEAADQTAKEATDRNANPDRKMKANLTKLTAALNAQLQQTSKKTLKARISDLPIAYGSLINQLASEHSPLYHNLFKSKRRLDPSCPFCSGKETTRHLCDFCPQYQTARRTLLTQAKKKKILCDWNQPHQLLKTPKAHAIVAAFLKSTGRFDYL